MKEFRNKFRIDELMIAQVGAWNISLRPKQPTIGSLILSLSRECESFSELTELEAIDLGKAFKLIEEMLRNTFNPQKINYLALMMVDNQVHYHVLPRYENSVNIKDKEYKDLCWPVAHDLRPLENITDHELEFIKKYLKD